MQISTIKPLALDLGIGRNVNVIAVAHEDRFADSHFSEPLTSYAEGIPDDTGLADALEFLFPSVPVGRRFEHRVHDTDRSHLSESDDIRAIGSAFKRVEYTGDMETRRTYNKGLTTTLDRDDTMDGEQELTVARLINRLRRNDLVRGVTVFAAGCTNAGKTWNAASDPDADLLSMLTTGGDALGVDLNRVAFGPTAWSKRFLALRASATAGAFASASLTPDQVGTLLAVDSARVIRQRYRTAKAGSKSAALGSYVFGFFAAANPGKEDPSHGKRFWTPTESGEYRVYIEEHAKTIDISVEHYSLIVMPMTTGARMLTIS